MKLSQEQRKEGDEKIKAITSVMRDIEKKLDKELFSTPYISDNGKNAYASFHGNGMLFYDIPYEIFMALPQKQLVIEIMRALTIEFNDYENE